MKLIKLASFEGKDGFTEEEAREAIAKYKITEPVVAIFSGKRFTRNPLVLTCGNADTANVTLNKYIMIAERYSLFSIDKEVTT